MSTPPDHRCGQAAEEAALLSHPHARFGLPDKGAGMECSLESCDRNVYTRELCEPHYRRLKRHGDVFADLPIGRSRRECSVPLCDKPADGRGLCHGHYQRWQRTGDVQEDIPLGRRRQPDQCTADERATAECQGLLRDALPTGQEARGHPR